MRIHNQMSLTRPDQNENFYFWAVSLFLKIAIIHQTQTKFYKVKYLTCAQVHSKGPGGVAGSWNYWLFHVTLPHPFFCLFEQEGCGTLILKMRSSQRTLDAQPCSAQ